MRRPSTFTLRVAVVAVAVAAAGTWRLTAAAPETSASDVAAADRATSPATVQTLQREEEFTGELGHGDSFPLPGSASGTLTWAPDVGTLLRPGDVLYRVDEQPTLWAKGDIPMYRPLSVGSKGDDVAQLESYLLDGGWFTGEVNDTFTSATRTAVKNWQRDNGLEQTGTVDARQLLFLPHEGLRVQATPRVGENVNGGVIEVTLPELLVTLDVNARRKSIFEGEPTIEVVAADGSRHLAEVESIDSQSSGSGGQDFRVTLRLPSGEDLEPGRVTVAALHVLAEDVLTVPVPALLATRDGYKVEVVLPDGSTEYRKVEIGASADGWIEVTGDLDAGEAVVVAQ